MSLSSINLSDIENAFDDFYKIMMGSEHFRVFFEGQDQVDALIKRQADNFYQSLSMSDFEFKQNYLQLGLMHAKMKLPFEDMVAALSMVRDNLLKNTPIEASEIYHIIEKMERYLAKGYLVYQFEDVISQLELSLENVEGAYAEADQDIVSRPLNWLKRIVTGFQNNDHIEHEDILTADLCPLTTMIHGLDVEMDLKQRILMSHTEQHSLALSMAFFFRDEDYMLASFMFAKLFAITVSLSSQIGLAVSHQAIEELHYDSLTGLLLRHSLEGKLKESINKCKLTNQTVAVMMLDLDHFKNINDTWGHQAGDKVLKALGELVQFNQREHDLSFRYGGEEFLLFVTKVTLENAESVAERIRRQVETLVVEWEGTQIPLTMSVGALVITPENLTKSIETYIDKADQNLYQAKDTGRNRVVISMFESDEEV
ncbi:MAG: GGDEF domain-containing protein [Pseudomonadota bacterium]|nr:GGDEF domain-containing protein [Pseudomonadota bacterium]